MKNNRWLFFQNRKTAAEVWTAMLDPEIEQSDLADALAAVEAEKDDIIEDGVCTAKEMAALIKMHREEEGRLADRRHALEAKLETLEKWLGNAIGEGVKWERGVHRLSWRESTSTEADVERLPIQYLRTKVEPDLKLIGPELKAGAEIPGARLVTKQNLQIK